MKQEYSVVQVSDSLYAVHEKKTGYFIQLTNAFKKANILMNQYNKGQGFCGWTPEFIAVRYEHFPETNNERN